MLGRRLPKQDLFGIIRPQTSTVRSQLSENSHFKWRRDLESNRNERHAWKQSSKLIRFWSMKDNGCLLRGLLSKHLTRIYHPAYRLEICPIFMLGLRSHRARERTAKDMKGVPGSESQISCTPWSRITWFCMWLVYLDTVHQSYRVDRTKELQLDEKLVLNFCYEALCTVECVCCVKAIFVCTSVEVGVGSSEAQWYAQRMQGTSCSQEITIYHCT